MAPAPNEGVRLLERMRSLFHESAGGQRDVPADSSAFTALAHIVAGGDRFFRACGSHSANSASWSAHRQSIRRNRTARSVFESADAIFEEAIDLALFSPTMKEAHSLCGTRACARAARFDALVGNPRRRLPVRRERRFVELASTAAPPVLS